MKWFTADALGSHEYYKYVLLCVASSLAYLDIEGMGYDGPKVTSGEVSTVDSWATRTSRCITGNKGKTRLDFNRERKYEQFHRMRRRIEVSVWCWVGKVAQGAT